MPLAAGKPSDGHTAWTEIIIRNLPFRHKARSAWGCVFLGLSCVVDCPSYGSITSPWASIRENPK
jgi:hypothetical protein